MILKQNNNNNKILTCSMSHYSYGLWDVTASALSHPRSLLPGDGSMQGMEIGNEHSYIKSAKPACYELILASANVCMKNMFQCKEAAALAIVLLWWHDSRRQSTPEDKCGFFSVWSNIEHDFILGCTKMWHFAEKSYNGIPVLPTKMECIHRSVVKLYLFQHHPAELDSL